MKAPLDIYGQLEHIESRLSEVERRQAASAPKGRGNAAASFRSLETVKLFDVTYNNRNPSTAQAWERHGFTTEAQILIWFDTFSELKDLRYDKVANVQNGKKAIYWCSLVKAIRVNKETKPWMVEILKRPGA